MLPPRWLMILCRAAWSWGSSSGLPRAARASSSLRMPLPLVSMEAKTCSMSWLSSAVSSKASIALGLSMRAVSWAKKADITEWAENHLKLINDAGLSEHRTIGRKIVFRLY